jgi:hypothetical protein
MYSEHFKMLFKKNFYGIRPPNPGSDAPFIRINLPDKKANP